MSCDHCKHALSTEVSSIAGVTSVEIDLETTIVSVRGDKLDHAELRAAIEEAGKEAS